MGESQHQHLHRAMCFLTELFVRIGRPPPRPAEARDLTLSVLPARYIQQYAGITVVCRLRPRSVPGLSIFLYWF